MLRLESGEEIAGQDLMRVVDEGGVIHCCAK